LTYCTRSIYLMSLIFYKHFHIACRPIIIIIIIIIRNVY